MELLSYPPTEDYLARNPLGSVPFLEFDGTGVAMGESVAMMLYITQAHGPCGLLPDGNARDLARVLHLTVFGEATFGALLNPLIMARYAAPEAERVSWLTGALEGRLKKAADFVDGTLGDRSYLVGEGLTLADISVASALSIWRGALQGELSGNLGAYLNRMSALPAFRRAVEAHG